MTQITARIDGGFDKRIAILLLESKKGNSEAYYFYKKDLTIIRDAIDSYLQEKEA